MGPLPYMKMEGKISNNKGFLDIPIKIQILQFIHPYLYRIISKELITYCENQNQRDLKKLPVSILISLNSIATLDHFQNVVLGYRFNYESFSLFVASWGNFETMQWFHSNGCCARFDLEQSLKAAEYGNLNILQVVNSSGIFDFKKQCDCLLDAAAIGGQVDVLRWIWDTFCNYSDYLFEAAGVLDLLEQGAKKCGQVDVLKWTLHNLVDRDRLDRRSLVWRVFKIRCLICKIVTANHFNVLEWIYSNFHLNRFEGFWICDEMICTAAKNGNMDIVRWLLSSKCSIVDCGSCIVAAAEGGNLEVLKYMRLLGFPWSETVCLGAAENGHFDVLKWAVSNGCPWNTSLMFPAVTTYKRPNLDLYQWLLNEGCPFMELESYENACEHGNNEFILFTQSNGSTTQWDDEYNILLIRGATIAGHLHALQWAMNQFLLTWINPPTVDQVRLKTSWIKFAAETGHVHILEYLRSRLGDRRFWCFGVTSLVDIAVRWGHINVLDWIVKYRNDWDKATVFSAAIKSRKLTVLIWLRSQSTDENTSSEFWFGSISDLHTHPSDLAFQVGNLEIFKWIHMNGCPWNDTTNWTNRVYRTDFVQFAADNGCAEAFMVLYTS